MSDGCDCIHEFPDAASAIAWLEAPEPTAEQIAAYRARLSAESPAKRCPSCGQALYEVGER